MRLREYFRWRKERRALRRDVAFAYWQWRDAGYLYRDLGEIYRGNGQWPPEMYRAMDDVTEKRDEYQTLRARLDRMGER